MLYDISMYFIPDAICVAMTSFIIIWETDELYLMKEINCVSSVNNHEE